MSTFREVLDLGNPFPSHISDDISDDSDEEDALEDEQNGIGETSSEDSAGNYEGHANESSSDSETFNGNEQVTVTTS
jgi:hypothetical protein